MNDNHLSPGVLRQLNHDLKVDSHSIPHSHPKPLDGVPSGSSSATTTTAELESVHTPVVVVSSALPTRPLKKRYGFPSSSRLPSEHVELPKDQKEQELKNDEKLGIIVHLNRNLGADEKELGQNNEDGHRRQGNSGKSKVVLDLDALTYYPPEPDTNETESIIEQEKYGTVSQHSTGEARRNKPKIAWNFGRHGVGVDKQQRPVWSTGDLEHVMSSSTGIGTSKRKRMPRYFVVSDDDQDSQDKYQDKDQDGRNGNDESDPEFLPSRKVRRLTTSRREPTARNRRRPLRPSWDLSLDERGMTRFVHAACKRNGTGLTMVSENKGDSGNEEIEDKKC